MAVTSLPPELNPYYTPPANGEGNPVTPPPEDYPPEWTLCGAAYAYIEYLARFCDRLAELAESPIWSVLTLLAAVVGGVAVLLAPGATVALALGGAAVATSLWAWVANAGEDGLVYLFTQTADILRTDTAFRIALAHEFVNGDTVTMSGVVDAHVSEPARSFIKAIITQGTIDAHKNGILVDGVAHFPIGDSSEGCDVVDDSCVAAYTENAIANMELVSIGCPNVFVDSFTFTGGAFTAKLRAVQGGCGNAEWHLRIVDPVTSMVYIVENLLVSGGSGIEFGGLVMVDGVAERVFSTPLWDERPCLIALGLRRFGATNKDVWEIWKHGISAGTTVYTLSGTVRGFIP
jgi:hypothetical protein